MKGSILAFSPDDADVVSDYCDAHSQLLPPNLIEHWEWTQKNMPIPENQSSILQGSWMIWTAQDRKPKRILEVGCFSGFSALAWYEGTKATQAEIITLELGPKMIQASKDAFKKYKVEDRVTLIEGYAQDSIAKLKGEFDLIFIDANKEGYETYVKQILDFGLLSKEGIILCDNVLGHGLTPGPQVRTEVSESMRDFWLEMGRALDHFSKALIKDPRIDVLLLPVFDGVTQIKWRDQKAVAGETNGTH